MITGGRLSNASVKCVIDVAYGAGGRDHGPRISQNYSHAGYVEVDICSRGDECIVSNGYLSYNDGVRTDPNTIFEGGCACARSSAGGANSDAMRDIDVRPQDCLRTDDDSAKVPNIQSWTDAGGGRDIEAVSEFIVVKHGSVEDVSEDPERLLPPGIEGDLAKVIGEAESRFVKVCGKKGATCCLAAVAVDVSAQGLPKCRCQFSFSSLSVRVC